MKVIIDTTRSPYSVLRPVPLNSVKINDVFWKPKIETLRRSTIPFVYEQLEKTGRIENFRRVARGDRNIEWRIADDADVYKWVEAASYTLAYEYDEKIDELLTDVVEAITGAQDEDGYLFTYYAFDKSKRWTNLRDMHELYCAGHLTQAAIAHYRSTGKRELLETAIRFANHIVEKFGPGREEGVPGHPEIEMAFVELYRVTGDKRYLDTSRAFVDRRGRGLIGGSIILIDHKPFRELEKIVGHAVRSLYLNCGVTDIYLETGDKELFRVLENLWNNMVNKKMYITGGVGSRYVGESFGDDYELPDRRAYAETCAAIANVMWNWRMFYATGEAKYMDVVELALYNGALSGVSLDGKEFFYVNPLADRGKIRRKPWYGCACCPTNIVRLLAYLPGLLYATSSEGIWVNLYVQNKAKIPFRNRVVEIREYTKYPWEGVIELEIYPEIEQKFKIFLRIPGWCRNFQVFLNGKLVGKGEPSTFFVLKKKWSSGDKVKVVLDMPVDIVKAHPHVLCLWSRVALKRGPIVYCFEAEDNPGIDVWDIVLPTKPRVKAIYDPVFLKGVVYLEVEGLVMEYGGELYKVNGDYKLTPKKLKAIPYYAWANRSAGPMIVWVKHYLGSSKLFT
ncbi:MAG TPA: glycoside hydrolase family 127 protein [Thermoproteales archaeon]|nr:glycoside hydrolase family 127 protein [Thermoproteales archaeon]